MFLCVGFLYFCEQTEIINKIYFFLYTQLKITGIPHRLTKLKVINNNQHYILFCNKNRYWKKGF